MRRRMRCAFVQRLWRRSLRESTPGSENAETCNGAPHVVDSLKCPAGCVVFEQSNLLAPPRPLVRPTDIFNAVADIVGPRGCRSALRWFCIERCHDSMEPPFRRPGCTQTKLERRALGRRCAVRHQPARGPVQRERAAALELSFARRRSIREKGICDVFSLFRGRTDEFVSPPCSIAAPVQAGPSNVTTATSRLCWEGLSHARGPVGVNYR